MSTIRDLRIKSGLTQAEAAQQMGWSLHTLQAREKSMCFPNPKELSCYINDVLHASKTEQIDVIMEMYGLDDFSLEDMERDSEKLQKKSLEKKMELIMKTAKNNESMLKQIMEKMGINEDKTFN